MDINDSQQNLDIVQPDSEDKPPMSNEEKEGAIKFISIYFVLGILVGFYTSLTLQLSGNGISSGQMAFWITSLYPLQLRVLFAPFVDSFYIQQLGKRRTYIIPCIYMLGFTLLILAYHDYSDWIKNLTLYPLYILMVFSTSLQAIATIATNGWVVSSMTKHYVHLGAAYQMIGWSFGYLISYAILMNLTSEYFCSSLGMTNPLISLNDYTYLLGILIIIIGILIQIFTKEHNDIREDSDLIEILTSVKKIIKIDNVRFLLLYLLFSRFSFAPVVASSSLNLIQMGFPQSQYAFVEATCTIAWIISSSIVGKYLQRGYEMTWALRAHYFTLFVTACIYFFVSNFKNLGGYSHQTLICYFILLFIYELTSSIITCSISGFVLRIADPRMAGTYSTILFCTQSFGTQFMGSIALFLIHMLSYRSAVFIGWLYGFIFYFLMNQRLLKIQQQNYILDRFAIESWRPN